MFSKIIQSPPQKKTRLRGNSIVPATVLKPARVIAVCPTLFSSSLVPILCYHVSAWPLFHFSSGEPDNFGVPLDLMFAGPRLERIEVMVNLIWQTLLPRLWQADEGYEHNYDDTLEYNIAMGYDDRQPPGLEPCLIALCTAAKAKYVSKRRRDREKVVKKRIWESINAAERAHNP